MASTGKSYIDQFTINNQGIMDLRELLFLTVLQFGSINETLDLMTGVVPGSRIGGVGEMEPVGLPSNGCDPQWNASKIATIEKLWELGAYEVAESICYEDLEETLVRFSMRAGTDRADLTSTDYIDVIVEPKLKEAMEKMIWRMLWLGDKTADNVTNGGVITDTVNANLMKVCDGLFKRLFTLPAAQRITIAANTAATKDAQRSGILVAGVAKKIFDDILWKAPIKLRQKSNRILMVTQSLADALTIDVKNNAGSDLQWTAVLDGLGNENSLMTTTVYNGQKIMALPLWDDMIQTFEDGGTVFNKPHRAVYTTKDQLKGGIHSSGALADLQINFDFLTQRNYMLAKDKVGALTWEDNLIMVAY